MNARMMVVAGLAALLLAAGTGVAVTIETVPVGNVGNADDTHGAGYGGVDYAYNIGKYEVTAGQYAEFLNAVAATDTYGLYNPSMWSSSYGCKIQRSGLSGNYTYSVAGDWANRPVNYVNWGDAARFVNWLHNDQSGGAQNLSTTEDGAYFLDGAVTDADLVAVKREADWKWAIPSEDEWYKAAYHKNDGVTGNYFDYPTSSDSMPGRDMTEATNSGNNANYYDVASGFAVGSPYYRAAVGEFELSTSPYDTFDQGGNVWEFNEAIMYTLSRGIRGGSWNGGGSILHATRRRNWAGTSDAGYVGFRVSEVPEPATLSLLALGGLALIRKRRAKASD